MRMRRHIVIPFGAVLGVLLAASAAADDFAALRARIQEVAPSAVAPATWRAWESELETLRMRAASEGDTERMRAVAWFMARLQAEDRGDPARALLTLRDTRERLAAARPSGDGRSFFLAEAALLARLGDREAILRLMDEYRASPWYAPATPRVRGGPDAPLRLHRPHAAGQEDAVLTAMARHARAASTASGRPIPAFRVRDIDGREHALEDYRGRMLLIDFAVHGAAGWHADLPARVRAWQRWREAGFAILSVHQNLDEAGIRGWQRRHPQAAWPQVARGEARELLAALGIVGEATQVLVDSGGRVIARDVQGAVLLDILRRALDPETSGP